MTKFNDEEFALFEHIVDKILSNKKHSQRDNFKNRQQEPSPHSDYVGEIFYQDIYYENIPFLLIFKKHLIDSNPKEKMDKSFMNRVNNFFDKDIFQISFEAHPYRWRRNFQDQVSHLKGGGTYEDIDKYNKEPFVKGISVQIYESGAPINIYDLGGDIVYEDQDSSIYIQTNDIVKAKQNTDKYFIKILVKALDFISNKYNKIIKNVEAKHKKKKKKKKKKRI